MRTTSNGEYIIYRIEMINPRRESFRFCRLPLGAEMLGAKTDDV
ncbi:MAG: hypothetical protein ABSE96_02420 [Terracidiphilus sp.]|jgi:hypothetical protein